MVGQLVPHFLDVLDEELRVSVGHVNADELHFRQCLHNTAEECKIGVADAAKSRKD
jgi:hypothetical protein